MEKRIYVNSRAVMKGKTKDGAQDTTALFLGAEDAQQLLQEIQTKASSPDGIKVTIFMGKTKDGSKDRASIAIDTLEPRPAGSYTPGVKKAYTAPSNNNKPTYSAPQSSPAAGGFKFVPKKVVIS